MRDQNEMVKLFTDGMVKTKDGREFTRMYGGFGEGKPSLTTKQIGNLLEYSNGDKTVNLTINRNIESFDFGTHILDVKNSVSDGNPVYEVLKSQGYSKQSISNSKNIYILSQAGFLLYLKFAEGDKAVELYKDFIEDYFKTKVENKFKDEALEDELIVLEEHKALVYGKLIMQKDEVVRAELAQELEDINIRIVKLSSALDNKKLAEALGKQGRLSQSKEGYLCQSDFGDRFNCKIGAKMIGKLFKIVGLAKRSRNRTIPYRENVPTYAYNELIENKDVDYDVAYHWNYTECIKIIDAWLKKNCEYERFYGITDKEIMELYINNLYKKYVAEDEE